jgi:hypothetical protein
MVTKKRQTLSISKPAPGVKGKKRVGAKKKKHPVA